MALWVVCGLVALAAQVLDIVGPCYCVAVPTDSQARGVALVMLIVVASYRQNVHAYPSGGGDYEVATTNLGGKFGLTVASALMVDYVLTVAVSTSSGIANIGSAVPFIAHNALFCCVAVVVVLTAMNLRGVRESGAAFAIPTYGFMFGVFAMVVWGLVRAGAGGNLRAESATPP